MLSSEKDKSYLKSSSAILWMVLYSSSRPIVLPRRTNITVSLAPLRYKRILEQDGRLQRALRMIYWEITLRDHLLLPITPDSSSDTTYATLERDNIHIVYELNMVVVRDIHTSRCSLLTTIQKVVYILFSNCECLNFDFIWMCVL